MIKIAFFAHNKSTYEDTLNLVQQNHYDAIEVHSVQTNEVVEEAKRLADSGVEIIIARGSQSVLIKQNVDVTVVDVVLAGQDICLLIQKCLKLVKKKHPLIAFVGIANMFDDLAYFDEVFQVTLNTYFVEDTSQLQQAVDRAVQDGADIVVGGNIVIDYCARLGVPHTFLTSTNVSIEAAIHLALQLSHAVNLQKKDVAQLKAFLDYSFNGIIRINAEGQIILSNYNAVKMLMDNGEEIVGRSIYSFFNKEDTEHIDLALRQGKESYYIYTNINNKNLYFNVAPILINNQFDGAVLSLNEIQTIHKINIDLQQTANISLLQNMVYKAAASSSQMKKLLKLVAQYAKTDAPILISGEHGTEKDMLALELHQQSDRKYESFKTINCEGIPVQEQYRLLYREGGEDLYSCNYGTLYVKGIEQMGVEGQQLLIELIKHKKTSCSNKYTNVRIIASTTVTELSELFTAQLLAPELYYLLCTLHIQIPPLRTRKEDIAKITNTSIKEYCNQYHKYVVLTEDAQHLMHNYSWYGNHMQLVAFCEGLVITAQRRTINAEVVRDMLSQLYPPPNAASVAVSGSLRVETEGEELVRLWKRYSGSRKRMAAELGISTTTLWRRLKKHGLG